jgi:hypothetical protein
MDVPDNRARYSGGRNRTDARNAELSFSLPLELSSSLSVSYATEPHSEYEAQ